MKSPSILNTPGTRLLKSCKRWFMSSAICGSTTTATRRVRRTTMRSGRQNGKYRLMPSSTGRPGGAKVGQKINDYPIPGGRFQRVTLELFQGQFALSWFDRFLSSRTTKDMTAVIEQWRETLALAHQKC